VKIPVTTTCLSVYCFKLKCKTNFDAPDAHFDYWSLFSDAQVQKVGNPKKKNVKTERAVGWNPKSTMKLSQIRRRIELCLRHGYVLAFFGNFALINSAKQSDVTVEICISQIMHFRLHICFHIIFFVYRIMFIATTI
jgi:hypothetical protein